MASSLVFRLHDRGPELLREVLLERGWEEYDERKQEEDDWNLYWRSSAFHSSEYHNLLPWQRLNHHPKTFGITRKDCLARNLRRMRTTFGSSLYDFSPTAFNLPNDYTRFLAEYDKLRLYRGHPVYWICKPVDLSRGRGIFIFEGIKDLVYDCPMIVQRYISNPLLISGYKFDLRIYVCVKSFHPLTVYIHQEGLVRFATEKYNLSSLQNLYSHLTNTSINRFGPFYKTQKGRVGQGCKWTMSKFRHFLHSLDINELLLWQRINNIVTLTLLTIASSVPSCPNCLELFGFDILVDIKFKPWLLEVNYSPALTLDCQADNLVKKGLISDLIDLMNYTSIDRLRDRAYQKHKHLCFSTDLSSCVSIPLLPNLKGQTFQRKRKSIKSSQNQTLPLLKTAKKRQTQSKHGFTANYHRHLPPVQTRGRTFNTTANKTCTDRTLNQMLDPHSRTNVSELNRATSPVLASCQMENSLRLSEVANQDITETEAEINLSTEADVSSQIPDTHQKGQGFRHSAKRWRLPNICSGSQKPERIQVGGSTAQTGKDIPPVRVGNFIRTFPFNAATLKASQHKLDVKKITQELQQLTGLLASGQSHDRICRGDKDTDDDDCFDSLLWGPKDPPLLSQFLMNLE